MRINQNISALNAYRNLVNNDNRLNKSLERLSSGLRINRAADDAAGLAISEKMRGQIRGLNQAMRNAQDGISLIQTAEGALNETHSILQRMRELSVQAANDTLTASDRVEIQKEINQLTDEINRIANTTEFNTKKLLDGTTSALASTDKLKTKVFMRDGLRTIDQFGQKAVGGGNYKLDITASPGLGQVQKTDIMKIKHDVGNSLDTEHVGHAEFDAGAVVGDDGAGDSGEDITLKFTVDGEDYTITAQTAADGPDTFTAIQTAFEANAELTALIDISGDNTGMVFTRVDPGDFTIEATSTEAGTVINNLTANTPVDVVASSYNVTGIGGIDANNFVAGEYKVLTEDTSAAYAANAGTQYEVYSQSGDTLFTAIAATASTQNQALSMEVSSISGNDVTFTYEYVQMDPASGEQSTNTGTVTLDKSIGANAGIAIGNVTYTFTPADVNFTVGDKVVVNTNADIAGADNADLVHFHLDDSATPLATYAFEEDALVSDKHTFTFFQLDTTSGQVYQSEVDLTWGAAFETNDDLDYPAAGFTVEEGGSIGDLAGSDTAIYDIDRFWDASGNFLVTDPQTIQLVQGDGSTTSFTIFGTDTIGDIKDKLNNAIHEGLGQKEVNQTNPHDYVWYDPNATDTSGHFTVSGTFVIQSAVTGKDGEITFIGAEPLINALSLTTIQQSSESIYTVNVTDAHDGTEVAKDVSVSGNTLVGEVHENVDVKFDPLAGIAFGIEDGKFGWDVGDAHTTYVHLADNTMVFHIGANPLQDVGAGIGDMRAESLGVDNILVTNQAAANRAITQVDSAIERVSSERSKLGAIQNRLEHTINNLGVAAENLTAAESRIRDLDFALEMVEFTRNQIMQQASTAMLAQANMKPQNVLMLLG